MFPSRWIIEEILINRLFTKIRTEKAQVWGNTNRELSPLLRLKDQEGRKSDQNTESMFCKESVMIVTVTFGRGI